MKVLATRETRDQMLQLIDAIAEQQLRAYYQPIVRLGDNQTVGAEVLMRWEHPYKGLLLPADFICTLEETGLISDAGEWILAESCKQVAFWQHSSRRPLSLSVNVSPRQLIERDFASKVEKTLQANQITPAHLCLEITESVWLDESAQTQKSLGELSELGVGIHIDDFGTGFAAMSYLKRLPVTGLKVDRGFVSGLPDSKCDQAICRSLIVLTQGMGLTLTCEGVERANQAAWLKQEGVQRVQGFHYAPGLPAADFEARLLTSSAIGDA